MHLSSTMIAELEKSKAESRKFTARIIAKVLAHLKSIPSDDLHNEDIGSYMVSLHESMGNQIIFKIEDRAIFEKDREREDNNLLKLQTKVTSLTHPESKASYTTISNNQQALDSAKYYVDKRVASLFHHFCDNYEEMVNAFFSKYEDFNSFDYQKIKRLFTLRLEVRPERVFKESKVKNAFEILKALQGEDLSRLSLLNAPLKFKGVRSKFVHTTGQTISNDEADINNILLSFMARPSYESVKVEDINVLMLSLETFPDKFKVSDVEVVLLKLFEDKENHIPSILNVLASFRQIYGDKVQHPEILKELKKLDVAPFYVSEQEGNIVSLKMINNYWIPRADIYSRNNAKVIKIKIESGEVVYFYQFLFIVLKQISNKSIVKNVGVQNTLMDNSVTLSVWDDGVDFFVSLGEGITLEKLQEYLEVCLNAIGSWSRKKPVSKMTGKFFKSGGLLDNDALEYCRVYLDKYKLDLLIGNVQVEDEEDIACDDIKL